ncbi:hypothetical protein CDV36_016408, partial [Fusarium kuroshium]
PVIKEGKKEWADFKNPKAKRTASFGGWADSKEPGEYNIIRLAIINNNREAIAANLASWAAHGGVQHSLDIHRDQCGHLVACECLFYAVDQSSHRANFHASFPRPHSVRFQHLLMGRTALSPPPGAVQKESSMDDSSTNLETTRSLPSSPCLHDTDSNPCFDGTIIPPFPDDTTEQNWRRGHTRAVSFDGVFQDGKAAVKRVIIRFPDVEEGSWYILRCHEHEVDFAASPFSGARAHLRSEKHGRLTSPRNALIIGHFGVEVMNCNAELAEKNNRVALGAKKGSTKRSVAYMAGGIPERQARAWGSEQRPRVPPQHPEDAHGTAWRGVPGTENTTGVGAGSPMAGQETRCRMVINSYTAESLVSIARASLAMPTSIGLNPVVQGSTPESFWGREAKRSRSTQSHTLLQDTEVDQRHRTSQAALELEPRIDPNARQTIGTGGRSEAAGLKAVHIRVSDEGSDEDQLTTENEWSMTETIDKTVQIDCGFSTRASDRRSTGHDNLSASPVHVYQHQIQRALLHYTAADLLNLKTKSIDLYFPREVQRFEARQPHLPQARPGTAQGHAGESVPPDSRTSHKRSFSGAVRRAELATASLIGNVLMAKTPPSHLAEG